MVKSRILIVEDEVIFREDLRDLLEGQGYEIAGAVLSGDEAVERSSELRPDLVLMDIKLKGALTGIEAACRIRARFGLPVVFLTAFADEQTIELAKQACPYGYLTKPINDRALRATIELALHRFKEEKRPTIRLIPTAGDLEAPVDSFYGLIGKSAAMRTLTTQIAQVARFDSTVLIQGETGTGKEVVARAIHRASGRTSKPLITVNCASLTPTLATSELFGHKRGAFTDSVNDHEGVFSAAEGGTIFLDEIADFPLNLQPFLLRILEEREVTRVGETTARKVNVRVLAASNRSLDAETAAGRFRSDLLYRIRVARIIVPPLLERVEDIPLLVEAFLAQLSSQYTNVPSEVCDDALQVLRSYAWPGHVRELRNAIEFAAIRCEGRIIQSCDLPPEVLLGSSVGRRPFAPDEERTRLQEALQESNGNRSEAARLLGVSRATFYRRLSEFGPVPPDSDSDPGDR